MPEPYYQDELVTLYHGDCLELTDWLTADVLVTDPPYGMSWAFPVAKKVTHRLIWHKQGRQPGISTAAYFPNDEEIYLLGSGWTGSPTPTVITTMEQRGQQPKLIGHPTPKPVGLMEILISKCPPGTLADPFAGSGATLIAARNLGRRVIGVEIEERYCELIASRLSQQAFDFGSLA